MCNQQRVLEGTSRLICHSGTRRWPRPAPSASACWRWRKKTVEVGKRELNFDDMQGGFTLLGLVGITDPPRDEAIAAVRDCHAAGIRVKMITGDHAETASAIAAQLGIGNGRALSGNELDAMDDAALCQAVRDVDVFARASPEHKLRLVQALQTNGEIVAMTGDGVNDAPALKRADIGVAMGMKGTEVAKEAAEMVLTDDNFSTIAHAVEEGRTVYDNLKKAIVFIMPTNGGEAGMVLIAILFGMTLPITPVQILWVNMVSAVTLALALSFEKSEADVMRRPPRAVNEPLLSGFMLWRIVFVSALLTLGPMALFLWESARGVEHRNGTHRRGQCTGGRANGLPVQLPLPARTGAQLDGFHGQFLRAAHRCHPGSHTGDLHLRTVHANPVQRRRPRPGGVGYASLAFGGLLFVVVEVEKIGDPAAQKKVTQGARFSSR